jgi:hypothetical protein
MGLPKHATPESYRVFLRDELGHIQQVVLLECDGDEDGQDKARLIRGASVIELWQGARMVCRMDGNGGDLPLFDK